MRNALTLAAVAALLTLATFAEPLADVLLR